MKSFLKIFAADISFFSSLFSDFLIDLFSPTQAETN